MKKSLVAVGVIVALGAAWTGASWYTGKQFAQRIDEVTAEMNKRLQETYPNSGLKLTYRDYQSGVFSSSFALVLQADAAAASTLVMKPASEFVMNETVSHGPLPLANLKRFDFVPALASVHSELAKTEPNKALFDALQGQPFVRAQTRVEFSGGSTSVVSLLPLDLSDADGKMQFSGTDFTLKMSNKLRDSHLSGTVAKLLVEKTNALGNKERLTLENFKIDVDNNIGKFDLTNGEGLLSVGALSFAPEGGDAVTLKNIVLKSSSREDDKNLAGEFSLAMEALQFNDRNLGALQFNASFSQLDGAGAKQFLHAYQALSADMLKAGDKLDADEFNQQLRSMVLGQLPQLLKGNPTFRISPISWKNDKGEATFNLALDLTNPVQQNAQVTDTQSDEEALIRHSVSKLDITLNAPMAMLAETMVQIGGQPTSDEERKQLTASALEQVKLFASIGEMNQMTVTKAGAITSAFHYADNQVDFNGRKLSLAEFIAPFIYQSDEGDEGTGMDDDAEPTAPDAPVVPQ